MTHDGDNGATVTEIRVLEGPNLYFNRPAAKVTLHLPGYLAVGTEQLQALGRTLGVRRSEAGEPNTEARQRFVLRLVERVVRLLVRETGLTRLGVRVRPGTQLDEVIVAFALNSRGRAQAVGDALEPMLRSLLTHAGQGPALSEAAEAIRQQPVGEKVRPMRPKIPVVSVTGTNGKTTTTRLIAHLGMTAGLRTGWSSTDGVLVQGELIASGDYSGPGGARAVLRAPGVQFAVLETARGGMLQKGLGTAYNDVSVVTNVSADHLGLHGIETVDQLAEVKAIITKVTKPDGWVVLNGDDPRVWAMRSNASAKPWCFSIDPDSPSLREALDDHGRGITVMDGDIVLLLPGSSPDRLLAMRDVPVTLAGLSEQNVQNVLAATAAALGAGLPREAVVEGLRSFAPDAKHNPGRMNIYTLPLGGGGRATVILDMAHNEAGLDALLRVADGLRPPGAQLQLGLGTGGDRTDEILVNMGEQAGLHADRVQVVHKAHYLRGRTMENLEGFLRQGLSRAGMTPTASWRNELDGLHGLISACHDGDVLALMTHSDWQQLHTWLLAHGATSDTPATIRRKVTVARGEHEAETELQQLWQDDDAERRIVTAQALRTRFPRDGRVLYELAGTHDSAGHEAEALELYDDALRAGLPEPYHHRALIQKASTLRHLARLDESLGVLDQLLEQYPDNAAVVTFRALTLHDLGRDEEALRSTAGFLVATSADADVARYHRSLSRFTAAI
ncbi:tetratricopeptide repeat protein [Rudaeicoccus suwonensis]|uniref:Cyanophycin synthetase n=1 Tax=Rudaeicoccus suwonensis TaxID=657409 RepID=A0A561EAS3_9MICO|nr:tetratricopeptide repeat protein [Rudaeicoccus suwonensis]TWE12712.1 cyanophycin synthetase [Rudaeicoccus suwonensis]